MASSASPKPRTRKTRGFLQMLIGHLKGREGQKEAEVWLHYKDQANRNGDQNWVARLQSDGKKGGQASWLETTLLQGQRWPPQGDDASKAEIMKTFWFESKIDDMAERKKNPANYAGIQPFHEVSWNIAIYLYKLTRADSPSSDLGPRLEGWRSRRSCHHAHTQES